MATSIRHPLRPPCISKFNAIVMFLCLCGAACHSADTSSNLVRKTKNGSTPDDADAQTSVPYSVRLNSAKPDDSGCRTTCHHTTKAVGNDDVQETTVNKPDLTERSNESTRHTRSLSEDIQKNGHQRDARAGALNKNFLRFGRGSLNKNFLRFGRGGNLKQNFLRFGRGGLQKNFLRFGRKDAEYDFDSREKVEDLPTNDESLDLQGGSIVGNAENLARVIERLRSEMSENQDDEEQKQENNESFAEEDSDGSTARGPGAFEMEENGAKVKRGSLSNNFLRFGRNYNRPQNMFSGKRGSLERNFLRFGKRSVPPNVDLEDGTSHKVKRGVGFDREAKAEEKRSGHGDSIQRRSLDEKLASQLNNNFIRFSRR